MVYYNLDLQLIHLVKKNPVLYDSNEPKYMDQNTREVTWQKIGDEMKRPAAECKARWINIRDINRKIIRKVLQNPGDSPKRMYKYFNELAFMRPYYKDLTIQNADFGVFDGLSKNCKMDYDDDAPVADDSSDDSEDNKPVLKRFSRSKTSKTTVLKKVKTERKLPQDQKCQYITEEDLVISRTSSPVNTSNQTELDPADKVDAFLLSIGATLKTFTPYHLNMAKTKIFSIVQEHELQQIVSQQGNSDALE